METNSEKENTSVALLEGISAMELKHLFPYPVTTLKGSLIFAKQFTVLVLSLITYSRGIFPAYAFSEKTFKGNAIKVLSGRRVCVDAHLFTKWLKSAFSALEKGYMKELTLEIVSLENVMVECYSVMYHYKEDSVMCSVSTEDKKIVDFDERCFEKSIASMVSSLLKFTKRLKPLPENFKLQLRILYFDERTPENFIPDYFKDCDLLPYDEVGTSTIPFGSISTPYHRISMKITSYCELGEDRTTSANSVSACEDLDRKRKLPTENQIEDETQTKSGSAPSQKEIAWEEMPRGAKIQKTSQSPIPVKTKSPTTSKTMDPTPAGRKDALRAKINMNCICNLNSDKTGIFQCSKCTDWHHLICYRRKVTSVMKPSIALSCVKCSVENQDSECLDSTLVSKNLPLSMVEKIALFRQMVFKLRWFALISISTLVEDFHVSEDQARRVVNKLMKNNLLSPSTRIRTFPMKFGVESLQTLIKIMNVPSQGEGTSSVTCCRTFWYKKGQYQKILIILTQYKV